MNQQLINIYWGEKWKHFLNTDIVVARFIPIVIL